MTSDNVRSELEKDHFVPVRLHLVSGYSVDIETPGVAWMLQQAVLVLHPRIDLERDSGYDVIALRNIERIEQLMTRQTREGIES